ncbi:MAG: gfo/Idh/MocA family oxidoreductase [Nitrospirae bacterium]|nr:MAG: gfo/Idh/MocA family oxidoreductase [Nitrospirota bacterium]
MGHPTLTSAELATSRPHGEKRVLVIGRGSIGQKHERNAHALGATVVTVDPDPDRNANFLTLDQALSAFPPDFFTHAVVACPVAHHLSTLVELLDFGVPAILVEKPLARLDEYQRAANLLTGILPHRVFMGFNWRFNSAVQHLKQHLVDGTLGRIHVAQLWAREWLPRYQGHVVLESGSHILDTARFLLGDLRVVGSYVTNHGVLSTTDEAASFLLASEHGCHVSIHVNFINPASYDYTILVQGDRGTLCLHPYRDEPMHRLELDAFFRGDTERLASLEDGLKNLALLHAIMEKAQATCGLRDPWEGGRIQCCW